MRGAPPRSHFEFDDQAGCTAAEVRGLFLQECVKRGILFGVPILLLSPAAGRLVDRRGSFAFLVLGCVLPAIVGFLYTRLTWTMPR